MNKTNAMRALDRAGVAYEVREYTLEGDEAIAEQVAAQLGMAPETVFKTLAVRGDQSGPLLALVPAPSSLNLRLLSQASGNKRCEMVALRDVLELTGYQRGAVTPLATKKAYPLYVDETAELWPLIGISAGIRGLELILTPADLVRATGAILADIAE
ncbi:MAG TPA: Cys-tRNA(Pro) deacylase [Roseiflexaceae bacterium]|nr:Cys-tRNA(Pro) deacylase [Roseiflexaceae bacterium]